MNGTSDVNVFVDQSFVWKFIAGSVVLFVGLMGNLTTCIVIVCRRKLHTPTYTVIAMLALSDCLAISVRYADTFYDLYMNLFIQIYYIIWGVVYFTLHASCAHIILLFYVRYRLVVAPMTSLGNVTPMHVIRISLYLWTMSILFGFSYGFFSYYVDMAGMGFKPVIMSTAYIVDGIVALLLTFIPVFVIAILHFKKYTILRFSNSNSAVRLSKQMTIIVIIVLAVHCASVLPFCLYAWLEVYMQTTGRTHGVNVKLFRDISIAMFFLNHTINPIIYFICSIMNNSNASPRQRVYVTSIGTRSVSASLSIISRDSDISQHVHVHRCCTLNNNN